MEKTVRIKIDDLEVIVPKGVSLLSILIEHGIFELKKNAVSGEYRFGICGMGTCFECEVVINTKGIRRACLIAVDTEMEVKTGGTYENPSS